LAQRRRIVLGCAARKSNKEIAAKIGAAADGGQVATTVPGGSLWRAGRWPRACHASFFTADYLILSSRNGSTIVSGWPYQYVPQA
jgi:hypothetical protein